MDLINLRKRRRAAFWGDVVPYLGYVIQSGVAVVFLFLLIAFSAWYTSFVRHIPDHLPTNLIMLIVLTPLSIYGSFRTYLQAADVIFLLPQESRMTSYFAGSFRSGVIYKFAGLSILFLTLWPLYVRSCDDPRPFLLFWLLLLAVKIVSNYGAWQELKMVFRRDARLFRLLRWGVIILILATWLWQPISRALIFASLLMITYMLSLRIPDKYVVGWDTLIAAEKAQVGRVMLMLSWFVDVPAQAQRVYPRRLLGFAGNRLPWKQSSAFPYLMTKTLVRSDILGILIRLTILGALIIWWMQGTWLGTAVYLFFVFVLGIQVSALRRYHAESLWVSLYPLPPGSQRQAVLNIVFKIQLVLSCLLWLPFAAALMGENPMSQVPLVIGTGIAGILVTALYNRSLARKWLKEDEEQY
ncbi:ABC transporter permease [Paenibacillus sediminis]|uniref:ABC-2 type transport system permease protein n=1 Tax=Paenibacillus sediminis TaxID=664909 RepID=A0ABS4H5V2_9BACL|nr:ABC transporter permease [Paenibacillus sediminis]MBP1937891.1 ABC-2 type transport system permease protein [Paenibacillus sediminis]